MTTKTGEKLRGRKRDPSVLEKAWATRRANKAKAKRAAARTGSSKRSAPLVSSSGTIHGYQRTPAAASTIPATKHRGSTTRGRKAAKARTSPKQTGRRSEGAGDVAIRSLGKIAQTLAVQAESPPTDFFKIAQAQMATGDDQLIGEWLSTAENSIGWGVSFPMSQVQAVARRLRSAF